jgi:rod shape-determining protein MreD
VARRWREPTAGAAVGAVVRDHARQIRRLVPLSAVLLSALVVHVGVAPHLAVAGAAPDVLLVGVVAAAIGHGPRAGAAFGFAAGLGADLFAATPLGTSALVFTLLGHVLGRSGRPASVAVSFAGVAAGRLGVAVVATTLAGVPFLDTQGLLQIAAVGAVSAPLGLPVFAALGHLSRPPRGRR